MDDLEFDAALEAALMPKAGAALHVGGPLRNRVKKLVDRELTKARIDPAGWAAENRAAIRCASRRPMIRAKLAQDVPEFTESEHGEFLTAFETGGWIDDWSPERKEKWHVWIGRVLPVLKVIAALTPPPYNLIPIALIVILTLLDERKLKPQELTELAATFAVPMS